jgi:hypothetical protein
MVFDYAEFDSSSISFTIRFGLNILRTQLLQDEKQSHQND